MTLVVYSTPGRVGEDFLHLSRCRAVRSSEAAFGSCMLM